MPKIAIVGTGLIGTSMALALKQSRLQNLELVGVDYDYHARSGAQKRNAFNRVESRLALGIRGADIVILATPVMAMQELLEIIGPNLPEGCIISDVGSSKKVVLEWAEQYLSKGVAFVGGHPMAGKEASGPEAADADLFRGKTYCIVPGNNAGTQAVSEITNLAESIGAVPYFIGVEEHDSFVAAASHLPFLLSVALIGCTSKSVNWQDIAQLASTGYKDVTRLASGDAVMHRDICVSNPEPIVAWIDSFIRELYEMRKLLGDEEGPKGDAIHQVFEQASDARSQWLAGTVSWSARNQLALPEIPSFTEGMGQLLMGSKVMEARKRLFNQSKTRKEK
jgi:prephenate dehydrogenase